MGLALSHGIGWDPKEASLSLQRYLLHECWAMVTVCMR
jgi:hypothetical protein